MKKQRFLLPLVSIIFLILVAFLMLPQLFQKTSRTKTLVVNPTKNQIQTPTPAPVPSGPLWFELHRKSNIEYLYQGTPGNNSKSTLLKTFKVKTGRPGERPTPLPKLLGKEYWLITKKRPSTSAETAPYFISLNIPILDKAPWGPVPYEECNGQCNWVLPGEFGLHGINGDLTRLSEKNPGSSGCIRHTDKDITYLYNLLEPEKQEIRYYVLDI